MLRSLYLHSYALQLAPMLISGTAELACSYATSLEILGGGERTNLMLFSTSSLFFDFCFAVMSNVNRG